MTNGIDVSKWQSVIDWPTVRASGIEFVMIKAANGSNRGTYSPDPCFERNIHGATGARIAVGVYLYSYGLSVAAVRGEAAFTFEWVRTTSSEVCLDGDGQLRV